MEITKLESIINELREEEVEPFVEHILAYLEHWKYKQQMFRKKTYQIIETTEKKQNLLKI